ncbi:MAG: co-chaperone GroES [Patescibacteria group bacterium]|nr:co-chaperone GroES [Candidatus Beckwithbacteria bacterium]MDZ4229385.1 co-chaperone GroES [Patescibacteria group bacterium]
MADLKDLKKKLQPAAGYLLVEPVAAVKKTAAGIYLPDSHDEKPQQGKVVAVGADEVTDTGTKRPAPCKSGDTIIYKKWGGNEVKLGVTDKDEILFIEFKDVLATVK